MSNCKAQACPSACYNAKCAAAGQLVQSFIHALSSCSPETQATTSAVCGHHLCEEQPHRRQFSLVSAQSQHIQQLSLETSSKSMNYHQIKLGYACEPYIQQANNNHLRKIIAQFCTGSHSGFDRAFRNLGAAPCQGPDAEGACPLFSCDVVH